MKVFGTSKAKKNAKAANPKPERKSIWSKLGGSKKNGEPQEEQVIPTQAQPHEPVRKPVDTPPRKTSDQPDKISMFRLIAERWSRFIAWLPLYIALAFAIKIVNEVSPELFSFTDNLGKGIHFGIGKLPEKPIIYEKGITPHPNKDDRIPVSALSDEYELNDTNLPEKLTGIGSLYIGGGRCTASLVGRSDFVVTAAHCLPTPSKRDTSHVEVKFYSLACKEFYFVKERFIKTDSPRWNIDLDYAFLKLKRPACEDAIPFQAVTLTDEAAHDMRENSYPLLSLSTFEFEAVRRHAEFPEAWEKARERHNNLETFGVFCRFSQPRDNVSKPENSLVYYTVGCDTFPGNSGGPLLISLDNGKSYQILATLFGHNPFENLFPRVKGVYAKNLESFYAEWALAVQ